MARVCPRTVLPSLPMARVRPRTVRMCRYVCVTTWTEDKTRWRWAQRLGRDAQQWQGGGEHSAAATDHGEPDQPHVRAGSEGAWE
eukprot:1879232-Prymnesium_polylepis.1